MATSKATTAFVTMVLTDSYVVGALVLGHSLLAQHQNQLLHELRHRMLCLVADNLSSESIKRLSTVWECKRVPQIDSMDRTRLALLGRPELGPTLTKLHVWGLHEEGIRKALFLDADMLVVKGGIDELFGRPEFAACPDSGWPDCFNSGLFVCAPCPETHAAILSFASEHGSFDGTFLGHDSYNLIKQVATKACSMPSLPIGRAPILLIAFHSFLT